MTNNIRKTFTQYKNKACEKICSVGKKALLLALLAGVAPTCNKPEVTTAPTELGTWTPQLAKEFLSVNEQLVYGDFLKQYPPSHSWLQKNPAHLKEYMLDLKQKAKKLGCNFKDLLRIVLMESKNGSRYFSTGQNTSGAYGYIGARIDDMETLKSKITYLSDIENLSPLAQNELIDLYLKNAFKTRLKGWTMGDDVSLHKLALSIFFPKALSEGKTDLDDIIIFPGDKEYDRNKNLDKTGQGITGRSYLGLLADMTPVQEKALDVLIDLIEQERV